MRRDQPHARGRARSRIAAIVVAGLVGLPAGSSAAPGDLDPGFGLQLHDNILVGLGEDGTRLDELRLLPDGRLVVLGTERQCSECFAQLVARYLPTGPPDPSFGADGSGAQTYLGFDGYGDGSHENGVVLSPDGRLLIGYTGGPSGSRLERVAADGVSPAIVTPVPAAYAPQTALADGRIVVRAGRRVLVLRPDLTPDSAFHSGAGVRIPAAMTSVIGVAASPDAILVAGRSATSLMLARLPLTGRGGSLARVRVPQPPRGPRYRVRESGQIVVRGRRAVVTTGVEHATTSTGRTVIAAFDSRGRADREFGLQGAVYVSAPFARVALQPDGKLVIVADGAHLDQNLPSRLVLRRLAASGRPDLAFRARLLRTVATSYFGVDVATDRRGGILVAAGAFTTFGSSGVLLARFQGE